MTVDAASGAGSYDALLSASNMATSGVLAKTAGASDSSATKASGETAANKDTFMKLLVAQLRYQDPSKPVESSEFIAQTAQFSSLESMEEMNKNNTQLLASQLRLQAGSMVGQTVSYTGADGALTSGVVTSASFTATSIGGTGGEPVLKVNGTEVVLSKVSGVGNLATGTAAAAGSTATGATGSTATGATGSTATGATGSTATGSTTTGSTSTP